MGWSPSPWCRSRPFRYSWAWRSQQAHPGGRSATNGAGAFDDRPDIYWIIVDRYGSRDTLQRVFEYDNAEFLGNLEERGFYVAEESRANYLITAQSLLATRNMEFLDGEALREQAATDDDWSPVYRGLRSHWAILDFLERLEYRFAYIGNRWEPTRDHPEADISYRAGGSGEFVSVFTDTTLLRALRVLGDERQLDRRREHYEGVVHQWSSLHRAMDLAGPKFVHAHLVLPHDPYVFDANGDWLTEQEEGSRTWEEGYVGQVVYANGELLELIDALLDQPAESRPVIIIQSDEGPWPIPYLRDQELAWADATVDDLRQKFGVLNAIYLPHVDAEEAGLYPSISLVNTFPVVFNAFFGTDLPLLPDRSYVFRDLQHIYELTDVTGQF